MQVLVLLPDLPAAPASWSLWLIPLAYRVKTRMNCTLTDRARGRGWTVTALGYPGYAAHGRARVRRRLLLAPRGPTRTPAATSPAGGAPVVRAGDGPALVERLDVMGASPVR
jgi:hypothetical protein